LNNKLKKKAKMEKPGMSDDSQRKIKRMILILFSLFVITNIGILYGEDIDKNKANNVTVNVTMIDDDTDNVTKVIDYHRIGYGYEPESILKSNGYWFIDGAYPTVEGYLYKRYYNIQWKDECPVCHESDCLKYESSNLVPWYSSPEGLLVSSCNDADYDIYTGLDHSRNIYNHNRRLIR
jgi:hypothetical protein